MRNLDVGTDDYTLVVGKALIPPTEDMENWDQRLKVEWSFNDSLFRPCWRAFDLT